MTGRTGRPGWAWDCCGTASLFVEVTCEGSPALGAEVWLVYLANSGARAESPPRGKAPVLFEALAAGEVLVRVPAEEGCAGKTVRIELEAGQRADLTIDLHRGWWVSGRVVSREAYCLEDAASDSTPPREPVVRLGGMDPPQHVEKLHLDSEGRFRVMVEPGNYVVGAREEGGAREVVGINADRDLELCLVLDGTMEEKQEALSDGLERCSPDRQVIPAGTRELRCGEEPVSEDCSITGGVSDAGGPVLFQEVSAFPRFERCEDDLPAQATDHPSTTISDRTGAFQLLGVPCVSGLVSALRGKGRSFRCRQQWYHFPPGTNAIEVDLVLQEAR